MTSIIHDNCANENCSNYATHNYKDKLNQGLFCTTHKLENMINVYVDICTEDYCITSASYNY